MQVHPGKAEGRWDEHGSRGAVRAQRLAVEKDLGIEFARPPRVENRPEFVY
jgi:hypothetical protein